MLYFILQDKTLNFRVTCFYGCTHMDRDTHVRECTGTHRWMQRWAILLKWKAVASLNTRQLSLMWINWYGKNRSSAVWVFVHWLYHAILTSFYFFFWEMMALFALPVIIIESTAKVWECQRLLKLFGVEWKTNKGIPHLQAVQLLSFYLMLAHDIGRKAFLTSFFLFSNDVCCWQRSAC